jgi:hypothetical protein
MKKSLLLLILLVNGIVSCNDKPSVEPAPNRVLSVYPNPTNNVAYVEVLNRNMQGLTLQVFNPKGELILEKTEAQEQFNYLVDLHSHPAGKFHVVLKSDKVLATQILLKL